MPKGDGVAPPPKTDAPLLLGFAPNVIGVDVDPPVAPNVKGFGPSAGFAPKGLEAAALFPAGCCDELDEPKPENEDACGAPPKLNENVGLSLFSVALVGFVLDFDAPKLEVPPKTGFGVSPDFAIVGAEPKVDGPAAPNGLGVFDEPVADPNVVCVNDAPVPPEAIENFGALDAAGVDEFEVFPTLPNTLLLLCCCVEELEGAGPNGFDEGTLEADAWV